MNFPHSANQKLMLLYIKIKKKKKKEKNEGLVPEKMNKISPQMEKKLTIVTSNREEEGK